MLSPTTPIHGSGEPWPWCQSSMEPRIGACLGHTPTADVQVFLWCLSLSTRPASGIRRRSQSEAIARHSPGAYSTLHSSYSYQDLEHCLLYPRLPNAVSPAEWSALQESFYPCELGCSYKATESPLLEAYRPFLSLISSPSLFILPTPSIHLALVP